MRMIDIIARKRDGYRLSKEEIGYVVEGYTRGDIPDYQMSALLMAIYLKGMDYDETYELTMAMLKSGDEIKLEGIDGVTVDKHSTGGVGDKTTLVLAPMLAALGIRTAKMSGRGLGHTGGTVDKLESFPGFSTSLSEKEFVENINKNGFAITGQTGNITPADKKIYALRDVTSTVESIPLIASSIMSKKLAAGADVIVLDVKCGDGAFMKDRDEAVKLAKALVNIGESAGRSCVAVISSMNEPLGLAVGNTLEVIEAIEALRGHGPDDLIKLCLELGAYMCVKAGKADNIDVAKAMLMETIENGSAHECFKSFVVAQGGASGDVDNPYSLIKAKEIIKVKALRSGYINRILSHDIGRAVMLLGGGRQKKGDTIDHSVGVVLAKKVGDYVSEGESYATIYSNDEAKTKEAYDIINASVIIAEEEPVKEKLILGVYTAD